jgi:hypothetical protein
MRFFDAKIVGRGRTRLFVIKAARSSGEMSGTKAK